MRKAISQTVKGSSQTIWKGIGQGIRGLRKSFRWLADQTYRFLTVDIPRWYRLARQNAGPLWKKTCEFFILLWINLLVGVKNLIEYVRVVSRYYFDFQYCKIDLTLLWIYLFDNPFSISKRFLKNRNEEDVYAYGETPLTSLDEISKQAKITKRDTVFEMGCGRGRTCFWLGHFTGAHVVGIDYVPDFIERANQVKAKFNLDKLTFRCEDMLKSDLSGATVIYLYGTKLDDETIKKLIDKFAKLPSGTKIITVSYPLTDYTNGNLFEVMNRFPVAFSWGTADAYIQYRK